MLRSIPIIITSNLGQDSDIERGMALGVVEYLVKANVNIDDLVAKVQGYLAKTSVTVG